MKIFSLIQGIRSKQHKFESRDYETMRPMRWINMTSIVIVLCTVGITTWFIYTNIYQTVGTVQSLLFIKAEPHFEPINFKLYNDTVESWQLKNTSVPANSMRDPFHTISTVSSTATTTDTIQNIVSPSNTNTSLSL